MYINPWRYHKSYIHSSDDYSVMLSTFLSHTMLAMDSVMHISLFACVVLEKRALYPSPHSKKWGRNSLGIVSTEGLHWPITSSGNKKVAMPSTGLGHLSTQPENRSESPSKLIPLVMSPLLKIKNSNRFFSSINVIQISFPLTFIAIKGWYNGSNKCLLGL